ncbi:MAG: NAD(P)H-quinone oxidoreductase [Bacteroidetes bacterium]|nr:NAD(P)H-quinone oxidoreductase [Bacteroidota bacterium]
MKAIIISKPGGPEVLEMQERKIPEPAVNDVLIKIKAAGVNRPDLFQRAGNYPPPPGASPDIPGLEVAGTIVTCGANVSRWKKGDRVCALLSGGGYAEYAVVDAGQCMSIPDNIDEAEACTIPETVFTVWNNVFQRGRLAAGENFLVHGGSGGIGITAIQLAKAFGANVFATAGSKEKCEACIALGAIECVNYKEKDFEEVFIKEGMDVILDMVGGDYIPKNINLLRPEGRLVFINAVGGSRGEFDVRTIMKKRLTITGSMLRAREISFKAALAIEVEKNVWPLIESGKFKPIIYRRFPLREAAAAHALMESSEHIGKIVLMNE